MSWDGVQPPGNNAQFAGRRGSALADGYDQLEADAWRCAVDGVPRPLFHKRRPILDHDTGSVVVRGYSETLLVKLPCARRPEKFGRILIVANAPKDLSKLTDAEFDALERQLGGAAGG